VSEWWGLTSFISSLELCTTCSGCQICCNWSRLKPGFSVPAHRSTMPQINKIPHPVTLNRHWANLHCARPLMANANQGNSRCKCSLILSKHVTLLNGMVEWLAFESRPSVYYILHQSNGVLGVFFFKSSPHGSSWTFSF